MKTQVTLKEWNETEYREIPCSSLSQAIAIMNESKSDTIILCITDEDSTGEITLSTLSAHPEVIAYNV